MKRWAGRAEPRMGSPDVNWAAGGGVESPTAASGPVAGGRGEERPMEGEDRPVEVKSFRGEL